MTTTAVLFGLQLQPAPPQQNVVFRASYNGQVAGECGPDGRLRVPVTWPTGSDSGEILVELGFRHDGVTFLTLGTVVVDLYRLVYTQPLVDAMTTDLTGRRHVAGYSASAIDIPPPAVGIAGYRRHAVDTEVRNLSADDTPEPPRARFRCTVQLDAAADTEFGRVAKWLYEQGGCDTVAWSTAASAAAAYPTRPRVERPNSSTMSKEAVLNTIVMSGQRVSYRAFAGAPAPVMAASDVWARDAHSLTLLEQLYPEFQRHRQWLERAHELQGRTTPQTYNRVRTALAAARVALVNSLPCALGGAYRPDTTWHVRDSRDTAGVFVECENMGLTASDGVLGGDCEDCTVCAMHLHDQRRAAFRTLVDTMAQQLNSPSVCAANLDEWMPAAVRYVGDAIGDATLAASVVALGWLSMHYQPVFLLIETNLEDKVRSRGCHAACVLLALHEAEVNTACDYTVGHERYTDPSLLHSHSLPAGVLCEGTNHVWPLLASPTSVRDVGPDGRTSVQLSNLLSWWMHEYGAAGVDADTVVPQRRLDALKAVAEATDGALDFQRDVVQVCGPASRTFYGGAMQAVTRTPDGGGVVSFRPVERHVFDLLTRKHEKPTSDETRLRAQQDVVRVDDPRDPEWPLYQWLWRHTVFQTAITVPRTNIQQPLEPFDGSGDDAFLSVPAGIAGHTVDLETVTKSLRAAGCTVTPWARVTVCAVNGAGRKDIVADVAVCRFPHAAQKPERRATGLHFVG
jgi:hypothetical protein